MVDFKYKISVIVPVYNTEKYLPKCLDSLVSQTIGKEQIEVLLIIDGSPDNSIAVCNEYQKQYPFFKVFVKENEGLSKTRNYGLDRASGKYIAFLDSDDSLSPDVLKSTSEFFDEHYDETDLVTYTIVPIEKGIRKKLHYRYDLIKSSGVYDLTKPEYAYFCQTNINIVVKNRGKENIKFSTAENFKHEDQKYNIDVISKKMTIGFCKGCEYLYEQNPQSIVQSGFHAYYIFETTMSFWEALFSDYEENAPLYYGGLFLNDLQWKIKKDILLPYHYNKENFEYALSRISAILKKIPNNLILNHPYTNEENKNYFIYLKYDKKITVKYNSNIELYHENELISSHENVDITITKFKEKFSGIEICGSVYSPAFLMCSKPLLYLYLDGKKQSLDLGKSSFCFNQAKFKNNVSWSFRTIIDYDKKTELYFTIGLDGKEYASNILFGRFVAFNHELSRYHYVASHCDFEYKDNKFIIKKASGQQLQKYKKAEIAKYLKTNKKVAAVRTLSLLLPKKYKNAWLYYDCKGVEKDNGYYQFIHDFYKKDGVNRYYVLNGNPEKYKHLFDENQQKNVVVFRSNLHKLLYLNAEKNITAYIENVNYIPFFADAYPYYIDLYNGETVYLQHGVLHAHLPWKYSYDRLDIDKEVISTKYEAENFKKNYCFPEDALIPCGMPRYDFIDSSADKKENKILYAPSWRKYLIGMKGNGEWALTPDTFLKSDYYKLTSEFLSSEKLYNLLEKNDWYLDFKPHPIFAGYSKYYTFKNSRIRMPDSVNQNEYKLLITDFSSFVFDFIYLKTAIIYFLPDYVQFKAGMNDYREIDIPFENGFGELTETTDEAVNAIDRIIHNDGFPLDKYRKKTDSFFINYDKSCRDRLYDALTKD